MLTHHTRKMHGDDATVDSVRGAGSLIGAARAASYQPGKSGRALKLGVNRKAWDIPCR